MRKSAERGKLDSRNRNGWRLVAGLAAATAVSACSVADPFMADRVTVTTETAKLRDDNAPPPPVNLDTYPESGCVFYKVAQGATCATSNG